MSYNLAKFPQVATGDLLVIAQDLIAQNEPFWVLVFEADNWQYLIRKLGYNVLDQSLAAMFTAIESKCDSTMIGTRWDSNRYVVFAKPHPTRSSKEIDRFVDSVREYLNEIAISEQFEAARSTCSVAMALTPPNKQVLAEVLTSLASSLSYYSMPSVTTTLSANTVDLISSEPVEGQHRSDIAGLRVTFETMPIYELNVNTVVGFHFLGRNGSGSVAKTIGEYHKTDSDHATRVDLMCFNKVLNIASSMLQGFRLHINVHPLTLANVTSAEVLSYIRKNHLSPEQVVVEVSFKRFTSRYKTMFTTLKELRHAGCEISYSDLGSGYSPFESIVAFEPDYIKIDRSMVTGAYQSTYRQQMVRTMVAMLKETGALIVAEGIEDKEDLAFITSLEIPFGQGHYYNKSSYSPVIW